MTWDDVLQIRQLIADHPKALRTELSRRVCLAWNWVRPDGQLKDMSCRVLLLKLHRAGVIRLPEPQKANGAEYKSADVTSAGDPKPPIEASLQELSPLRLERVATKAQSSLWNELIHRYHYLGYSTLPGAQIRYFIQSPAGLLGVIGFSAAAWKIQPRDVWIGWSPSLQKEKLHLIVNNSRFLILPWVKSKNLASHILSRCAKQLSFDWQETYGYTPVLLETFVEKERFAGTCYRAANWIHVGATKGRGRSDVNHKISLPLKDIFVLPLCRNFRTHLLRP
jgi:hypothetical protein